MFGGYHSLLPSILGRIFKKPVFIILGGTECVSLPKYNYGSLKKPFLKKIIKWSFIHSSCLVPVHESLIEQENNYIKSNAHSLQGVKTHFPNLKTPFKVIYNGFQDHGFNKKTNEHNSFITVAIVNNKGRFYLKGIDKILLLAEAFPESSFKIIGISENIQEMFSFPDNVETFEFSPYHEFKKMMEISEFYIQLSISEGFPNALCEGMINGCIPVASAVGGMPDIISDTGFILKCIENNSIIQTFSSILSLTKEKKEELSMKSRNRILNNYTLERREIEFLKLIHNYVK